MRSVALDSDGDIALNDRGQSYFVDGVDAQAQDIRCTFLFFKGEWFLDKNEGVPYYERVLGVKAPSFAALNRIWRQVLLGKPYVISVDAVSTTWADQEARIAQIEFEVQTEEGPMDSSDFPPVIVKVP